MQTAAWLPDWPLAKQLMVEHSRAFGVSQRGGGDVGGNGSVIVGWGWKRVCVRGGGMGNWYQGKRFLAETPHCFLRQLMAPNTFAHSHLGPNLRAQPPLVFSSSGSDQRDGCQARLPRNPFVLVMWPSSIGRTMPPFAEPNGNAAAS